MSENKKFRLRPKAEEGLENIYEYSYREFGSARARGYIHALIKPRKPMWSSS